MIDRFTQKAREAIRLAVETAQELEHGYVGTEHLLLGLIKEETGVAAAVLAEHDEIETLIFDEIDTGISGRTAQKVSERLAYIAKKRQVIAITHLPQIAAMADTHFEIEKHQKGTETITEIHPLEGDDSVRELARLLGGAELTQAVFENAKEMKELARVHKNTRLK